VVIVVTLKFINETQCGVWFTANVFLLLCEFDVDWCFLGSGRVRYVSCYVLVQYALGGSRVVTPPFSSSALHGDERSASRPYYFIHRRTAPRFFGTLWRTDNLFPFLRFEPWILGRPARSLVAIPAELRNMSTKRSVRDVGSKLWVPQIHRNEASSARARCLWPLRIVSQLWELHLYGHLSLETKLPGYDTIQLSLLLFFWTFRDIHSMLLFHQLWFVLILYVWSYRDLMRFRCCCRLTLVFLFTPRATLRYYSIIPKYVFWLVVIFWDCGLCSCEFRYIFPKLTSGFCLFRSVKFPVSWTLVSAKWGLEGISPC
jgi:hypothetical protein